MARLVDGAIGVNEEHLALRDAVRAFAQRNLSSEQVRASLEPGAGVPAWWGELADTGFLGLHLPESVDGAGYGLVEACVVAEELGAHLVPGPVLSTLATSATLRRAGWATGTPEQRHLLRGLGLADTAAFAPLVAGVAPVAVVERGDGFRVSGAIAPTACLGQTNLLLTPGLVGEEHVWVLLDVAALGPIDQQPGLDPTRPFGTATAADLDVPAHRVLRAPSLHPLAPMVVWSLLASAEACGSAAWSTRTAAEYAGLREQFGRTIGAFQGVKHRCAQMLVRTEQARVLTWDAARALEELWQGQVAAAVADLAVAIAASVAPLAAFENSKACIDTLGAIGYTWEHDASFHFRRARTATVLVGGAGRWREQVGRLALRGVQREVGIELPTEAETVRLGIRAEVTRAAGLTGSERTSYLAENGYTVPHLPVPWGKGADAVTQLVIAEELAAAQVKAPSMIIGQWVVPTLVEHGTAEQQHRWVPKSLTGEHFWCQLFSEPGAGSDLASLTTRATKVEGGWRVTGTKIWTSAAQYASHGILLARTEPEAAKHAGISYFVLDMTAPGIDIRPIVDLTGSDHFNQVFLDEVFIPDADLVGERGKGWGLARTTLANERVALGSGSLMGSAAEAAQHALAAAGEPAQDELRTLGRLIADAQSLNLFGLRAAMRSVAGAQPGAESSVAKYIGVRHHQEARELAVEWGGVTGLVADSVEGGPLWRFLNARNESIAGGTLDVQLNIIGERLLGLPRDL